MTPAGAPVCALSELDDRKPFGAEVATGTGSVPVVLVRQGDEVHALRDECSHAELPLSEGEVYGQGPALSIECWLHGSCFNLRTGVPSARPATEPVDVYPVTITGGLVYVDPTPSNQS